MLTPGCISRQSGFFLHHQVRKAKMCVVFRCPAWNIYASAQECPVSHGKSLMQEDNCWYFGCPVIQGQLKILNCKLLKYQTANVLGTRVNFCIWKFMSIIAVNLMSVSVHCAIVGRFSVPWNLIAVFGSCSGSQQSALYCCSTWWPPWYGYGVRLSFAKAPPHP